jgi:uncharacterized protein YlxW (UPF0749 family)
MINARGTDLRGGRHSDLASIVADQSDRVKQTRAEAASVQADIDRLTTQVNDPLLDTLDRQMRRLTAPTGMTPMSGPGLVVTLNDAPAEQEVPDGVNPNLFVVHQQDLQAVINALWAGGAEGISLQDQRIIATTGIKCVGNTVRLHDVPYAPPYVIRAVGDPGELFDALSSSPQVQTYRSYTLAPYNLGWELREEPELDLPAYSEPITLQYAEPATD